jgi:CBS domain-containing protein
MARKMRDIVSSAPICMAPGESVSAAAKAMKEHGIGTVLVLTEGRLALDRGATSALPGVSSAPPNC